MNGKEVIAPRANRVECRKSHYLVAHANPQGLLLKCNPCKDEHLITWEELEALRQAFLPVLVKVEQVS